MSLRCDWFVLCERVLEDTQSGNLTLVNCLDQVMAWAVPSTMPGFAFAARFSRENRKEDDGPYEFRLMRQGEVGPEEQVLHLNHDLESSAANLRLFVNFAVIRLFREEVVLFRMDWRRPGQRWRHGPSVPLRVLLHAQELRAQMLADVREVQQQIAAAQKT